MNNYLMPQVSKNLIKASDLLTDRFPKPKLELSMNWHPSKLKGQLNELIGEEHSAHLTITSSIIQSFQAITESVVWITPSLNTFFPPDMDQSGIDLSNLTIINLPNLPAMTKVTERLAYSNAFGLIILEITPGKNIPHISMRKLMQSVTKKETAIVFLNTSGNIIEPFISLRGHVHRDKAQKSEEFHYSIKILKDRQNRPGLLLTNTYRAPDGMR